MYFTRNLAYIGRMSTWLRTSLIALVATLGLIQFFGVEGLQGSFIGFLVGIIAFGSLLAYLVLVFLLTRSLDPKPSVAWTVLLVQLIPILGFIIAISIISKGLTFSRSSNLSNSDVQPDTSK